MRILIASGSSGGHIFPALSLIDSLKDSNQLLLVLPEKTRENRIPVSYSQVEYIRNANLTLELNRKNIIGICLFLAGGWQSLRIILKFKPDVVVGFGSLNTLALIFWAWLFRINTVIHEQNVIPGKANRILALIADKVAFSFKETAGYLNLPAKKTCLTGNPLRKGLTRLDKRNALDYFGFKEGKLNILITGGSQGSHKLNEVCFAALIALEKKEALQVIHITGKQDYAVYKDKYAASGLRCKVFDFLDNMQFAYSFADAVISRSGATTVAELQKFCLPALLVPYPFAYAHQSANACVLEKTGGAFVIKDEELSVQKIQEKLIKFLENPGELERMRRSFGNQILPDSAGLLAKEVLNFQR